MTERKKFLTILRFVLTFTLLLIYTQILLSDPYGSLKIVCLDRNSPGTVTNLSALLGDNLGEVKLRWTAVGDDVVNGVNVNQLIDTLYRIQYSSYVIAFSTYSTEGYVKDISTTNVNPGEWQQNIITGLSSGVTYYFRIWTRDESANWSGISNGATIYITYPPTCTWISPAGLPEQTSGYTLNQRFKSWFLVSDAENDNISDVILVISTSAAFDVAGSTVYQRSVDTDGWKPATWPVASGTTVYYTPQSDWTQTTHYLRLRARDVSTGWWGSWSEIRKVEIKQWTWTDTIISTATTLIRKVHVDELRTVINNVRNFRNYSIPSWTDPTITAGSTPIRKVHFDQLRQFLDDPLYEVGKSTGAAKWVDYNITAGETLIRVVHIEQLRAECAKP